MPEFINPGQEVYYITCNNDDTIVNYGVLGVGQVISTGLPNLYTYINFTDVVDDLAVKDIIINSMEEFTGYV